MARPVGTHFLSGREVPLRAAGGQEGEHLRFSPSCQSTPFPSGRAARARVSDAFQLPPGCYGRVSGTSATPRGALGWQSCPPCCKGRLGGRRKASPTFTREARPGGGGGDSQEEGEPRVPPPLVRGAAAQAASPPADGWHSPLRPGRAKRQPRRAGVVAPYVGKANRLPSKAKKTRNTVRAFCIII